MRRRMVMAIALAFLLCGGVAGVALAAFPQSAPNDPGYATDAACSPEGEGEYWLFSFIPPQCLGASDPQNAAGMSVDSAWRDYTTGDPHTVMAYVEGGVNYRNSTAKDLVDKMYLNTGELPLPERADGSTCPSYDCNGDGVVNVEDYANDPRLKRPYLNGYLTPEDLIVAFGHCRITAGRLGACPPGGRFDNDRNGYPNDIAGWDFQHDSNDVETDWASYSHSDGQTSLAAAQTDNGIGQAGECPRCQLMYVKTGDEAIARPDRQAEGILYAVDAGAKVIVGEAVGLGYSTFQRRAFQYAWDHGVPVSFDSNDFESTDHTDGMFFDHVLPANSLVQERPVKATVKDFIDRSSVTSWGTHSVLSVPTLGGSTSEATPVQGGALALVVSYGRQTAPDPSAPPGSARGPLSAGEVTQLMIASAMHIQDPSLGWPGKPGYDWSLYYGYGRPNLHTALQMIQQRRIPPVPDITSPRWYARYDPATNPRGKVQIDGTISARRAASATYRIQYALGPEPAPGDWHDLPPAVRVVHGTYSGRLGTLNLSAIPRSFYERPFRNTGNRTTSTTDLAPEQYAVTLRVVVTDSNGLTGVDRRAIYVQHDPDRLRGFPRFQGPSGESAPVLADLQGRHETDIVIANADGTVHAYRPSGTELPGWPVHTNRDPEVSRYAHAAAYRSVRAPDDPIVTSVAIGSLRGDGALDVVATTTNGRVYAWDEAGHRLRGFPVLVDDSPRYPVPSPTINGHSPTAGAVATPVLADLTGNGQLDIVQAAWDQEVHVLQPNGRELPGWPVKLELPAADRAAASAKGQTYFDDAPIVATPSIGDIAGEGRPQVIVGSQESLYAAPAVSGQRPVYAIQPDGNRHAGGPFVPGWPVFVQDNGANLTGGIDFIIAATSNATLADFLGTGHPQVVVSTTFGTPQVFRGDGTPLAALSPAGADAGGPEVLDTFTTSGAVARTPSGLAYFAPGSAFTSVVRAAETSSPIYNLERGWNPVTGAALPGFPEVQQGLAFVAAPAIADVSGGGQPDVLQVTDSMTLHAFRADGSGEAPGFPKFTGGWSVFAPAVGDLTGDGHADVVLATREGYLDAFRTPGKAANAQWCGWQGDAAHTGLFMGRCTLPRGKPLAAPRRRRALPALRLSVRPRSAVARRHTSFRLCVTARVRRRTVRVRGALVTLRGRRAYTDRRGCATVRATLPRPGRYVARASRRGYRGARASVRARRARRARRPRSADEARTTP